MSRKMSDKNNFLVDKTKTNFSFDELYDNLDNCITCIVEKLKKGNICAFVGAGFSSNANRSYPGWSELLMDAYKEMYPMYRKNKTVKKCIEKERETKVAQQYVEFRGCRESIDSYIESKLKPVDKDSRNELMIHKKLLKLNWADVITTNWDTLLEQADSSFGNYDVVKNAKQLRVNNKKRIVKVNGSLRSDDEIKNGYYCFDGSFDHLYIITDNDFLSYEQRHNDFSNFMKVELLENSFCLFGFSGNDPNFRYWVKSIKSLMTKGGRTEEPNPIFMFTLYETKDAAIKQFYRNNYIIPIFIDNVMQKISTTKPNVNAISKIEATFIKATYDSLPSQKFNILFDYLNEKTFKKDEVEVSKVRNQVTDPLALIVNRKTESLTESQMTAYNKLEFFGFSNLKYTEYFIGLIRQYVRTNDDYSELFYDFLARWLTNNFYSLHLLLSQNFAKKIVEKYVCDFLPHRKAVIFMVHALRYCYECNEALFNKITNDYLKDNEFTNAIHYQKLLAQAYSFDYENYLKYLDEWKPEETDFEDTPLYILRKVYLILLFENRNMISSYYSDIDNLLRKAEEKVNPDSQLAFFIYDLHARILYTMKMERFDSLDKKRTKLAKKFISFKQYLAALNFEEINRDFYKPNSDIRNKKADNDEIKKTAVNKQISFVRILNFMEYIGCPAYEVVSYEQIIDFTYSLKDYAGEVIRVLLAVLSFFGESANEAVLRKILPFILRTRSDDCLNELFTKILVLVNYKVGSAKKNPKVYIWFLWELVKRCDRERLVDYANFFTEAIKSRNQIIISLIQGDSAWGGVNVPFIYAVEHIQSRENYLFLLEWVMGKYLSDKAELTKASHYLRSEFEQYYYAFFRNESCKNELKSFFNEPKIINLLNEDANYNFFLLQCAYEYLEDSCKLKQKTEAYLVENMSLEIDPYVLTKVSSKKITVSAINFIKNYDFSSWRSTYGSPVNLIRALNQIDALDDDLRKKLSVIIQEKNLYLDTIEQNNEYIKKSITSAKIVLFFMAQELGLKDDFVEKLKTFYTESKKDVLSFAWLFKSTSEYSDGFEDYLRYCSFTEPTKLNLGIIYTCLAKILLIDIQINEAVLEKFIEIYTGNPFFSFVQSDTNIKTQLVMIMKKFRDEIAFCYDDLFIKKEMKMLAQTMKEIEKNDLDRIIDYWISM